MDPLFDYFMISVDPVTGIKVTDKMMGGTVLSIPVADIAANKNVWLPVINPGTSGDRQPPEEQPLGEQPQEEEPQEEEPQEEEPQE